MAFDSLIRALLLLTATLAVAVALLPGGGA